MSAYVEFLKKSFRQRYIYRANTYINILSALFKLFVQISIWYALLSKNGSIKGISFQDMVSYVIINMLVLSLIHSNMGSRLAQKVQEGSIAIDLIRPVTLKYCLLAEELGENCFRTIFITLPVCIVSVIFLKFQLPDHPIDTLLFIISIINGIILIYYINYTLGLLSIWFGTSFYIDWFLAAFFELFAGTAVPLWFYPDFLYKISNILPFRLVSFEPIAMFLGKTSFISSLEIIILQIIWIIILILLEKFIWTKAQDKIIINGG